MADETAFHPLGGTLIAKNMTESENCEQNDEWRSRAFGEQRRAEQCDHQTRGKNNKKS